jgi:hypothetical protein
MQCIVDKYDLFREIFVSVMSGILSTIAAVIMYIISIPLCLVGVISPDDDVYEIIFPILSRTCFFYLITVVLGIPSSPVLIVGFIIFGIFLTINEMVKCVNISSITSFEFLRELDPDILLEGLQQQQKSSSKHSGPYGRQLSDNSVDESFVLEHIIQTVFQKIAKNTIQFVLKDIDESQNNNETGKRCY